MNFKEKLEDFKDNVEDFDLKHNVAVNAAKITFFSLAVIAALSSSCPKFKLVDLEQLKEDVKNVHVRPEFKEKLEAVKAKFAAYKDKEAKQDSNNNDNIIMDTDEYIVRVR